MKQYEAESVFVGERDEDGYVLWEQNDILNLDIERLQEALLKLRRAFALTAYHYWETSVYQWFRQENPKTQSINLGNYRRLTDTLKYLKKHSDIHNIPDKNLCIVSHISDIIKHTSNKPK